LPKTDVEQRQQSSELGSWQVLVEEEGRAMPSPRTPRVQAMGATNHSDRLLARTADLEAAASKAGGSQPLSARSGVPRLSALDRVREDATGARAMTSRVSTGTSIRHLLPHIGISPRDGRKPVSPVLCVRVCLPPLFLLCAR